MAKDKSRGCLYQLLVLGALVIFGFWALRACSDSARFRQAKATAREHGQSVTPDGRLYTCDRDLWAHVYRHSRLRQVPGRECITARGWVREKDGDEDDGDLTFELEVDSTFLKEFSDPPLLNEYNESGQNGHLMVEIICTSQPRADHARKGCQGWVNPDVPELHVGDYVEVHGPHVEDTFHKWMEIHPAQVMVLMHGKDEHTRSHHKRR